MRPLLLFLLLLSPLAASAQMYKCKDERGRLFVSDIPCKGQVKVPPPAPSAPATKPAAPVQAQEAPPQHLSTEEDDEEPAKPAAKAPAKPGSAAKAVPPPKPAPNTPKGKAIEAANRHASNQAAVRSLRERCDGWRAERMQILDSSGAAVKYNERGERVFKADKKTTERYAELNTLINGCPPG